MPGKKRRKNTLPPRKKRRREKERERVNEEQKEGFTAKEEKKQRSSTDLSMADRHEPLIILSFGRTASVGDDNCHARHSTRLLPR